MFDGPVVVHNLWQITVSDYLVAMQFGLRRYSSVPWMSPPAFRHIQDLLY
jgi:hypothetical protein